MTKENQPICDYEGSVYQEQFWDLGGREYEDAAEAIALQHLLPVSGNLLLELGAGAGRNTPRYIGFKQVVLLDYSLTQLQQAIQRLGRNQHHIYVAADIYNLPFVDGLFDAATMIRTLHHLSEPRIALRQVRRTLQPGATFIMEYANKHNLKAILRYWLKKQAWSPFTIDSVEFEKLNFDFHPQAVRSWLKETDFTLDQQLSVSYLRLGVLKKLFPIRLLTKLDGWLQPTGNRFQLSPSVFTRSLASGSGSKAESGKFFMCPMCTAEDLMPFGARIICKGCSREWPIRNGIFDFRMEAG